MTRPNIAPAKRVRIAAERPVVMPSKYHRLYSSTATPIQDTIMPSTHWSRPMRMSRSTPSAGIQRMTSVYVSPAMIRGAIAVSQTAADSGASMRM